MARKVVEVLFANDKEEGDATVAQYKVLTGVVGFVNSHVGLAQRPNATLVFLEDKPHGWGLRGFVLRPPKLGVCLAHQQHALSYPPARLAQPGEYNLVLRTLGKIEASKEILISYGPRHPVGKGGKRAAAAAAGGPPKRRRFACGGPPGRLQGLRRPACDHQAYRQVVTRARDPTALLPGTHQGATRRTRSFSHFSCAGAGGRGRMSQVTRDQGPRPFGRPLNVPFCCSL